MLGDNNCFCVCDVHYGSFEYTYDVKNWEHLLEETFS